MSKIKNLRPWLEFFELLQRCEEKGFLEVLPYKREAYITQPALHALTPGDDPQKQVEDGSILETVTRIRAYCAWKGEMGDEYLTKPFALNVVKDEAPHELLYTLLVDTHRNWLGRRKDFLEVFDYSIHEK